MTLRHSIVLSNISPRHYPCEQKLAGAKEKYPLIIACFAFDGFEGNFDLEKNRRNES